MQTTSPAGGERRPRRGTRLRRVAAPQLLYAAPVVVMAAYGALWVATHAEGGRGSTHTLWQCLTLTEITVAMLLRDRKPTGALVGILAAYLIFDLPWLTLPSMLFALLAVAAIRGPRTATVATTAVAAAIAAGPYLHGDAASLAGSSLPLLAAAGAAAAGGSYLRRALARTSGEARTSRAWTLVARLLGRLDGPRRG